MIDILRIVIYNHCANDSASQLSKKPSKKELPKRPLFLVRVKSLVCTGEMIGPSRSGAGRDALPRVRRSMSRRFFWCFSRCAQAMWAKRPALLLENRAKRDASPSLDLLRRIARERVPTARIRPLPRGYPNAGSASLPSEVFCRFGCRR